MAANINTNESTMAANSKMSSVWVQLYSGGKLIRQAFELFLHPLKNVNALKEAVKAKTPELTNISASLLKVYATDAALPIPENAVPLRAGLPVPLSTSDLTPLVVVAPLQSSAELDDDFIRNVSDEKQVDEWRTAYTAINSAKDTNQSTILLVKLPATGNQFAKRVRIEQECYLMVQQPVFMQYERAIFEAKYRNFVGMTGPQGFGKSVFLHYLATKRAFGTSNLGVWVPYCPPSEDTFKRVFANAFYTGCEATELTGILRLKLSVTMNALLLKMKQFAEKGQKFLLVIIDQVHKNLSYFGSLTSEIQSFAQESVGRGHVGVVSSSTSRDVSTVFGHVCKYLVPYDQLVTMDELKLLTSQHGAMNQDLLGKEPMSFLQTIGLL